MNATDLQAALGSLADQALTYSDADRALAVARRRRRVRAVTPVVAACVAVLLVGVGWLVRSGPAVVAPVPLAGALPAELVRSPDRPPALPLDRGVGLGVAIYTTCETCGVDVQLANGRRYAVTERASKQPAGLSPDGRWLVVRHPDRYAVRDLTGTLERQLRAPGNIVAWSPDSRWLLEEKSGIQHRIDLLAGETKVVAFGAPGTWRAAALLAGGDALLARYQAPGAVATGGDRNELMIVDPDTGSHRSVRVDASRVLRANEYRSDAHPWAHGRMVVSASGEIVYPRVSADLDLDNSVIIVPIGSGPARRIQPAELSGISWGAVGFVGNDLLLDSRVGQRHELLRIDSVTGARRSTTKIGAGIWSYAVVGMAELLVIT